VVLAASLKGIKTFIHEQNAFPGVTNRILSRFADVIFISFEESKKYFNSKRNKKIVLSGNPLREDFLKREFTAAKEKLGIRTKDFAIICFGGSRGAEKINEEMINVIEVLNCIDDIKVFFVTGKVHYDLIHKEIVKRNIVLGDNIKVLDYIYNMPDYMSACDLVISRAGALTISEICALGKPSILIPSPYVTGNHQYHNAKVAADRGAAYIIEERDLSGDKIIPIIFKLKSNNILKNRMSEQSKSLSHGNAVNIILEHIEQYLP